MKKKNNIYLIFLTILLLSSSCSPIIKIGLDGLKNLVEAPIPGGNASGLSAIAVMKAEEVESDLEFTVDPANPPASFLSYDSSCEYRSSAQASVESCLNYGDNAPNIDTTTEKISWLVSTATPKGIYTFTIHKVYSNVTLEAVVSFSINISIPFVTKWNLSTIKLKMRLNPAYTYNFMIDWGDATPPEHVTASADITHTYDPSAVPTGEVTVSIYGEFPGFGPIREEENETTPLDPNNRAGLIQAYINFIFESYGVLYTFTEVEEMVSELTTPELYDAISSIAAGPPPSNSPFTGADLLEVVNLGAVGWKNLDYVFSDQFYLSKVSGGDLSQVTSMNYSFMDSGEVEFDTSTWNLANVESAKGLFKTITFHADSNFSGLTFSSKLTDASEMFMASFGNLSGLTNAGLSGVKNFNSAFENANLTNLNTALWNVQSVEDFSKTFKNFRCNTCNFTGINITNKALTSFEMFRDYKGPAVVGLGSIDMINVVDSSSMFEKMNFAYFSNIASIDVHLANKNMKRMFFEAIGTVVLDTSSWNTTNVENMESTFEKVNLDGADLSGIVVGSKNLTIKKMFYMATNLALHTNLPGKAWDTSSLEDMEQAFYDVTCKTSLLCNFDKAGPSSATKKMAYAFHAKHQGVYNPNYSYIDISNTPAINTSSWNMANVEDARNLFAYRDMIGSNLSGVRITNKVTSIEGMFQHTDNLVLDTSLWDLSNVTNANYLFEKVDLTNTNLSGIVFTDKLTTANWPFRDTINVTIDTSAWDISNLVNATDFFSQVNFIDSDLSGFNPSLKMNQLGGAFYNVKDAIIDTTNWELSPSVNLANIFAHGQRNTLILRDLDLFNIPTSKDMFWGNFSDDTNVYIMGSTTEPSVNTSNHYIYSYGLQDGKLYCENLTSFLGLTCQPLP